MVHQKRHIKKGKGIWILSFLTVFWLSFLPLIWPAQESSLPSFFHFFDRHYLDQKQSLFRFFKGKDFAPSSKVEIFRMNLENRAEFWLDPKLKLQLKNIILQHPGPVLTNLDPDLLRKDEILKPLLSKPNFYRDFKIESGVPTTISLEPSVAEVLGDQSPRPITFMKRIVPSSIEQDPAGGIYGSSMLAVDAFSHFVYEYPLMFNGAQRDLPSMGTAFAFTEKICSPMRVISHRSLECVDQKMILPNPLSIFFYRHAFPIAKAATDIRDPQSVLIVEAFDGSSLFTTFANARESWGGLMATVLSNLLQKHFFMRPLILPWWEFAVMALFAALIIWQSRRVKLRSLIPVVMISGFVFVLHDFILTYFFQFRTAPIPHLLSLTIVGVVAISVRAIRDFQERNTLEKALSGYVSEQRLQNLLTGREQLQLQGQKKELCTLILDIAGFSKIAESLPPDAVFNLLRDFFSTIDPLIFKHGGFIDKKTGDGLIACFGDDPMRSTDPAVSTKNAIEAAIDIQKVVSLPVRIGINTGFMVIGNSGSAQHFNYTVIGEAVNFTQRLEAACPKGSILIGSASAKFVKDLFQLKEVQIHVKGEEKLFPAFEVLGSISS